jgi:hypothetical protein
VNAFGCDWAGLAGCVSLLGSGRPLRQTGYGSVFLVLRAVEMAETRARERL